MKYAAVIFDMDGTIVDNNNVWNMATMQLLALHGVHETDPVYSYLLKVLHGVAFHKACYIIHETIHPTIALNELIEQKRSIVEKLYAEQVKLVEGFADFHQKIADRKMKMAIATNADDAFLMLTERHVNLRKFFGPHVYTISQVAFCGKPDPAIYLHAARALQVPPEQCIAIEDSYIGVRAAKAAGMYCVGIGESASQDALQLADMCVDKFHQISIESLLV